MFPECIIILRSHRSYPVSLLSEGCILCIFSECQIQLTICMWFLSWPSWQVGPTTQIPRPVARPHKFQSGKWKRSNWIRRDLEETNKTKTNTFACRAMSSVVVWWGGTHSIFSQQKEVRWNCEICDRNQSSYSQIMIWGVKSVPKPTIFRFHETILSFGDWPPREMTTSWNIWYQIGNPFIKWMAGHPTPP